MQWKDPTTVTYSEINDTLALLCKTLCNHILLGPYHPGKIYKCSAYKEDTSMDFECHMLCTKCICDVM